MSMNIINNIIGAILAKTNERWFIPDEMIRITRDRYLRRFNARSPVLYVRRIAVHPYKALTMQMMLTMMHPKVLIRTKYEDVLAFIGGIESLIPRPPIRTQYALLYSFLSMYMVHLASLADGINYDILSVIERPSDLITKWLMMRIKGTVDTSNSAIETVDLIRAHHFLHKYLRSERLPRATYIIIGAGGVGWWTAEFINAFTQHSKIIVFDFDDIEPHNFNRLPLPYTVLVARDNLKKVMLLAEKLDPFARVHHNELIVVPDAFVDNHLSLIESEARSNNVFVIEATDSPKFQLWIKKSIKQLGQKYDNIVLIQGHYNIELPNIHGFVELYRPEAVPEVRDQDIENSADYAEGQSIGLPAFLVADTISLAIAYVSSK